MEEKNMKKTLLCLLIAVLLAVLCACGNTADKKEDYDKAVALLEAEQYAEAAKAFRELGYYEDAKQLADYAEAVAMGVSGDNKTAAAMLGDLGKFGIKDSSSMATYYSAKQLLEKKDYKNMLKALTMLESISDVKDSKELAEGIRQSCYEMAKTADAKDALAILKALGDYSDAATCLKTRVDGLKEEAGVYAAAGEYDKAIANVKLIAEFEDVAALERYYNACKKMASITVAMDNPTAKAYSGEEGTSIYSAKCKKSFKWADLIDAAKEFEALGEMEDCKEKAETCKARFEEACGELIKEKNYKSALEVYKKVYADGDEKLEALKAEAYTYANELLQGRDYTEASKLFKDLGTYKEAKNLSNYCDAAKLQESDKYKDVISGAKRFLAIADFSDAADRAKECMKAVCDEAMKLAGEGKYEDAITVLTTLKNEPDCKYDGVDELICEVKFQYANSLCDTGNAAGSVHKAYALYTEIAQYKNVNEILSTNPVMVAVKSMINGEYVLGSWEQDNDIEKTEEIKWVAVAWDDAGNTVTLASVNALDVHAFDKLDAWLNGDFAKAAFTQEEMSLVTGKVALSGNTPDALPAISAYCSEKLAEAYKAAKGSALIPADRNDLFGWWNNDGKVVFFNGYVSDIAYPSTTTFFAVRPAVTLDLAKVNEALTVEETVEAPAETEAVTETETVETVPEGPAA